MRKLPIKPIDIPDIDPRDIQETIMQAKRLLAQRGIPKQEHHHLRIVKDILLVQGARSIWIQVLCTMGVLLLLWLQASIPHTNLHALLFVGATILSIAITAEVLRSDICQMRELETAALYPPERMLLGKMFLLGSISFAGILVFAITLSIRENVQIFMLLVDGLVPFLMLNALVLYFYVQRYALSIFLLLYGIVFTLGLLMNSRYFPLLITALHHYGTLLLGMAVLSFLLAVVHWYRKVHI